MSEASRHSSVSGGSSDSSSLGDHGVEESLVSQNVQTDRNLFYPGDAINQASTTSPRTSTSMSSSSQGGHSSFRVAQVIPTTRSVTNSPTQESNYSSGDDSESDGAANSDEEESDLGGSHQDFQRAHREHRSIRLMRNTSENRQRQVARVIPRRYVSFRLHPSELFVYAFLHELACVLIVWLYDNLFSHYCFCMQIR